MKKTSMLLCGILFCCIMLINAGKASAWSINTVAFTDGAFNELHVKFQIINDSVEDMLAFGVGVDKGDYDVLNTFAAFGSDTVGSWYREQWLISESEWSTKQDWLLGYGNEGTWQDVFLGFTWGELFSGYDYAYVATGTTPLDGGGRIPSGTTYGEADTPFNWETNVDFGYVLSYGIPTSPIAVRFDESGVITGFTNTNYTHPDPIPEPSTWLLLGTGLLGLLAYGRKKLSGRSVHSDN